jgi:hypothetical protein
MRRPPKPVTLMLHFFDTNILLFSISQNPAEKFKRDRAVALLDDDSGTSSIQRIALGCGDAGAFVSVIVNRNCDIAHTITV